MKQAISLERVSDVSQADNTSTDSQYNLNCTLVKPRGIFISNRFTEQKSGRSYRQTVEDAYQFCKSHYNKKTKINKISYLIIYDWTRWFRNAALSGYWTQMFRDIGVEINAAAKWINYDNDGDLVIHAIEQTLSEIESRKIRRHTLRGIYQTSIEGGLTNAPPRGVIRINDGTEPHYIIVCPKFGSYYTEAFNLMSCGVKPAVIFEKHGSKIFGSRSSFYEAVHNPIYAGRKYVTGKLEGQISKWVELRNKGTVTNWSTFQKVQQCLNKTSYTPNKHDELFFAKSSILCPKCFNAMTSEKSKGRNLMYYYYRCSCNYKHSRYRKDESHAFIEKMVKGLGLTEVASDYLLNSVNNLIKEKKKAANRVIGSLKVELNKAEKRENEALNLLLDKKISQSAYDRKAEDIQRIKFDIASNQNILEQDSTNQVRAVEVVSNIGQIYPSLDSSNKQLFLNMLFPEGFIFNTNKPTEQIEYCRTARVNSIFDISGLISNDYNLIKIETGLITKKSPVLGGQADADRIILNDTMLFERVYYALGLAG